MYSTIEAASLFGVSRPTITAWAGEFSAYLSVLANPGKGRARDFTADDMKVLALVAQLKERHYTYAEIHEALKGGERGEFPDVEPSEVQAYLATEEKQVLNLRIQNLESDLLKARLELERVAQLRQDLATAQETAKQATERATRAESMVNELYKRIGELQRELGRLEGRLDNR